MEKRRGWEGGREGGKKERKREREREVKAVAELERIPVTRNDRSPFVRRLNDRGKTLTYTVAAIVHGICWCHHSLSSIYALPSFRFRFKSSPRVRFTIMIPLHPTTYETLPPMFHPPDIILPLDSRIPSPPPGITTAN